MMRNSQPTHLRRTCGYVEKLIATEGRIFFCIIQLLTASSAFAQSVNVSGPHSGTIIPYTVDGLALGARIEFESPMYRGYQCSPSEQFPEFTRCQRTQKQQNAGSRRYFDSTSSILHSQDGTAVYINRYVGPAIFDRNEIQSEINRLSSKFGERAREMRMPQREGFPNAVIASWGKVQLEQLDADAISLLAAGQSPRKGLLIDYLGDLRRSAQLGLPIYSLNGGAGYLWSASVDRSGRGHLRFLTVDASALTPATATQLPSGETKEPEKIATEKANADAEVARVEAEKARVNDELPTAETEKVKAPEVANADAAEVQRVAAAKEANFDALLARLEADLARAEATTQAMETVAHRAIVSLLALLIIVAALLLVWRRKARAKSGQVHTSEIKPINPAQPVSIQAQPPGPSELVEQKSVASKDTSPNVSIEENKLNRESLQSAATNLRPCIHCNLEISIDDKFCMYCGASVASKDSAGSTRLCSSCRNEIDSSDKFCRHCGASSIAVAAPSMTFSNEGDNEIIAKGVQATRKRTTRKKAIGPQGASSQPDGRNPSGQ
jgi:hypothetical protein